MREYHLFKDPANSGEARSVEQALTAMLVTANSVRDTLEATLEGGGKLICAPGDTLEQMQARYKKLVPGYQPPVETSPDFIPGKPF